MMQLIHRAKTEMQWYGVAGEEPQQRVWVRNSAQTLQVSIGYNIGY